jgi:type I restriction enzyme S subunit
MTYNFIFGECAELCSEKVDPQFFRDSPYIGLEHIEQQTLSISGSGWGVDVNSQKQKFKKGDILFGKLRPYFRKVVIAPFDGICSTDIWVVRPKPGIDRNFVFYWMASEEFVSSSTFASEGGRMPRAKWDWVSRFRLPYLPLKQQQVIGKTLRILDEKIETNKQLSKTLEDIAQTIFKSWFIDFDPVKAKMAGEKPVGMDDATAALFPDSMEDSELGMIPVGWSWGTTGDLFDIVGGGTPSTGTIEFWNGDIYWTTPKDLSIQNGLITTKSARLVTLAGLAKISSGLLGRHSVLMSCRAPIGYLSVTAVPTATNQGIIAILENEKYSPLFLVNWLLASMSEIENRAGGATFAEISKKAFRDIPFLECGALLNEEFNLIASPILLQLESLTEQTDSLIALRDGLLPRLISGELKIPEEMLVT